MSAKTQSVPVVESLNEYDGTEEGFREFLHDLADDLFPFPGYRQYQDEILYEAVEALFVDGYRNVIIDGPTGIGKSPINVTIGRLISALYKRKNGVRKHFGANLNWMQHGNSFYTTPQKQLRNQLAEDDDLREYVDMLKSRQDYYCEAGGTDCKSCTMGDQEDQSCRTIAGCTYWGAKATAMDADIAALTFAMLVVDNRIPHQTENGERISFTNRDLVIVDEGHNLENQVASLFAGFTVSKWTLPDQVFRNADRQLNWGDEKIEDVEEILDGLLRRAKEHIRQHEDVESKKTEVEQCKNFVQKAEFAKQEHANDRAWVVTVDSLDGPEGGKKMTLKPVDVDNFLSHFIWNRGTKRVISSATIPYRNKIDTWADRIGLSGDTKMISRPMPFPEENRLIQTDSIVCSMSGDGEDKNWDSVVAKIKEIAKTHEGENGLIHTTSYKRAEKLADALDSDNVIVQDREKDKSVIIAEWCESDKDILLSPSMTEGVDLYDDRCRWQILMKVPYAYVGDSRVSYLLNERHDWEWYNQTAMLDVMQSIGRAVRGPEDHASYYVIDQAFHKLMGKVATPDWFSSAIRR